MRNRVKRNSKNKYLRFIIGFVILLVLVFILIYKSGFFSVREVLLAGEKPECVEFEQIKTFFQFEGKNLFFLSEKKSIPEFLEKFYCIFEIRIYKVFPNKIKLEIFLRKPLVKLTLLKETEASISSYLSDSASPSAQSADDIFLIDKQGVIFSKNVTYWTGANIFVESLNLNLGKKMEGNIYTKSLVIINYFQSSGIYLNQGLILNNTFIVFSNPKIVFNLEGDINTQIASLQLILQKAKIDSEELRLIDLRFDKPIIQLAPKK